MKTKYKNKTKTRKGGYLLQNSNEAGQANSGIVAHKPLQKIYIQVECEFEEVDRPCTQLAVTHLERNHYQKKKYFIYLWSCLKYTLLFFVAKDF